MTVALGTGTVRPACLCTLEEAADERSVGGKAWNLARMLRLGLPVPRGIVLTDAAFQAFLDENRLRGAIARIRRGIEPSDLKSVKRAAEAIRELVDEATVPGEARAALAHVRQWLDDGRLLIVRSSAVGEDSTSTSFAGQLDSFRDVQSLEELERALLGCWASCWSERALYYQHSRGVRIERMGVVVQEQVRSKTAGVLFTVSPESEGEMLGEFCPGDGEDLVSGRVNPGRFSIAREDGAYRFLADPEPPDGEACPSSLLDVAQVRTLHRLGLLLEDELGGPQDVEWTIDEDGRVEIVQARPVTAPGNGTTVAGGPPVVWSNANINENYPDPVCPFLYSIAADGYFHYFRNLARAFGIASGRIAAMDRPLRNTIGCHGGRLYYNLTNIHAALRMAPFGRHLVESFNIFVGAEGHAPPGPETESFGQGGRSRIGQLAELAWIAGKTARQFLFLNRGVRGFERTVDAYAERAHPAGLPRKSIEELHALLRSFLDIRCHRWTSASLADAASMIGYGLLKRLISSAFPEGEHAALHNKLLQGLPDLASAQPVIELWKLSRLVHADPDLRELLERCDGGEVWDRLRADERFAAFRGELEKFLEDWGFRRSGELMMTVKSFQEDPSGLFSLLASYVTVEGESPVEMLTRQADEREAETKRVYRALRRKRLCRWLPWPRTRLVGGAILRWTQGAIGLRERARLKQSLLYSRCRRVVLRIGERLVERGFIERSEDVFFLTHQELDRLLSGGCMFPDSVGALVELRRKEHARLGEMTLPDTMTLPEGGYCRRDDVARRQKSNAGENGSGVMGGLGVCGGKVTARATVLNDVSESGRLTAGDVLVTRQTDPGWAPVFFLVSGLVMERGGMLSHGAIVAREYGIPTVVGVDGATRRIASGQKISVDGDAGRVELLG